MRRITLTPLIPHKDALNEHNESALLVAAKAGHFDVVKLLLEAGANKNVKDDAGKTAVEYAIVNNHHETARLLNIDGLIAKRNAELASFSQARASGMGMYAKPQDAAVKPCLENNPKPR